MYWEGPQLWRPNERPFALHRNGYAGMQRYGAFLWSGDVYTTWETLKTHVPVAVNTGLSGIPFWGTDIGGFVPTAEYTGELHVRWFQFGDVLPVVPRARPQLASPTAVGLEHRQDRAGRDCATTPAARPIRIRASCAIRSVEPIVKKYLELRYRLLPYTYTAARECCETGLPMMRALWLHYPDDPQAVSRGDQFLWGRDILVSPGRREGRDGAAAVPAARRPGTTSGPTSAIEGGREIERAVDLETMPLYVRAGAIIPHGPGANSGSISRWTDRCRSSSTRAPTVRRTIYEDDGKTFDYRKGEWMGIEMAWRDAARTLTLRLARGSRMLPPTPRPIEVRLAGRTASPQCRVPG